jgi:uncharacterized Zn finger protein
MPREPPSAVTTHCPQCGEDTLHTVLRGTLGERGEWTTLDATVQCTECQTTHHALIREAKDVDLPVVLSEGGASRRTRVAVPGDEEVSVGEAFIVDGLNCVLTGIEAKDMRRVDDAHVKDVRTLWMKQFEEVPLRFAINLGHKTITKSFPALPSHEVTVGEEHVFGRLRVTVHAIKTKDRLLKRGTAEAGEVVRVFARPTPLGDHQHRPDKRTREQLREKEARREERNAR